MGRATLTEACRDAALETLVAGLGESSPTARR